MVRKADCGGTGWNVQAGGLVSFQPSAGFGSTAPGTVPREGCFPWWGLFTARSGRPAFKSLELHNGPSVSSP